MIMQPHRPQTVRNPLKDVDDIAIQTTDRIATYTWADMDDTATHTTENTVSMGRHA